MAIDTNIGISYNENFPTQGIDQSSQGFRDNFLILKRSIENLQAASASASSALNIASTIGSGGEIKVTLSFKDNAFTLPSGSPTTPVLGMVRQQSQTVQFYDGTGWRTLVSTDTKGGITLPSTSYLKLPTGVSSDRPSLPSDGMIRFNATLGVVEVYRLGDWVNVASGSDGQDNTFSGTVHLLVDAIDPDNAVNLRSMRTFFSNAFKYRSQGLSSSFNQTTNTVDFYAQPFDITLNGEVTGTATVTNFGSVEIETVIPHKLTTKDIRDEVGSFVKGTVRTSNSATETETGITVNYDEGNNTLELGVREFDVVLTGAVTGTGHSKRLNTIVIDTITDRVKGITAYDEGLPLGLPQAVQEINFVGDGVSASLASNTLTVTVPHGLSPQDVRDTVGDFVTGTIRDTGNLGTTESGIFVNYDAPNNRLEIVPRDFTVALTGAVTGSALISRLGNTTITTQTDLIRGLQVLDRGSPTGLPQSVREVNFTGNGVTVSQTGNVALITVTNAVNPSTVRDIVGSTVQGSNGITAVYDPANQSVVLSPRTFTVALAGPITGSAVVSNLGNVTIATNSGSLISGISVSDHDVAVGNSGTVTALNFTGNGITTARVGNSITVTVPGSLTTSDVRNTVGSFVTGTYGNGNTTTESGITVNYDAANNNLQLGVREFTIGLSGAVTGSAIVSRLGNVTIQTETDSIRGVTVYDRGQTIGLDQTVKSFNFTGAGVTTSQSSNTVTINIPGSLTTGDVRNTVGTFIQGTVRDPSTQVPTESGIIVNYDSQNNVLEVAPRQFNITLNGAVQGSGTVTHLNNVAITTTADFLTGLSISKESILLGSSIKKLNFVGGNASVTGDTATFSLTSQVSANVVSNAVNALLVGDRHAGIKATYDSANSEIDLALKPINIRLLGAVTGNGTVTYTGNAITDGKVTIETEVDEAGIEVRDEGQTSGTVKTVNFVGGGITTAVSIDGLVATVYVPNSPANEKFLLLDSGSANVPNARKLTAGTGILLDDGGPGGAFTISASSDALVAKSRIMLDGDLVGERAQINILSGNEIIPEVVDNPSQNEIGIRFYGINEGWYRPSKIDCGLITDRYGPSIDLGSLQSGIIETDADMGRM